MKEMNPHAFAIVESVEAGGLRLRLDGEDAAGEKLYKCNTFFAFSPGDRVYCVRDSGTYVAICKIGTPADTIKVDEAEKADTAETAKTAESVKSVETAKSVLAPYGSSEYKITLRWNGTKGYIEYTHEMMSGEWKPLLAPLDEATQTYEKAKVVQFRSTSAGKLEFCVPYRSAYTWHTITST